MSWDILIQDVPVGVASVADIPDDFVPASIGLRADLIVAIREIAPTSDFSDPSWGELATSDFVIEFNMGMTRSSTQSCCTCEEAAPRPSSYQPSWLGCGGARSTSQRASSSTLQHRAAASPIGRHFVTGVPEWEPDTTVESPAWLAEGARVLHATFGPGTVGRVGEYKEVPCVWNDFDDGQTKALALEFVLPHLSPERPA